MFCPNCGESNAQGLERCTKCGKVLDVIAMASSTTQPQTQVAYPFNYPAAYGQVPLTVTAFAPPPPDTPLYSGSATVPAIPPPPPPDYPPVHSQKTRSVGLVNLFEVLMAGVGFLYAGDVSGGICIFTGTLIFVLVSLLLTGSLHGLAVMIAFLVLLAWFVLRLVVVNRVVSRRNRGEAALRSSAIAAFLEAFCPGMGCFYARKVGTGLALLFSTAIAMIGAGCIVYILAVQAYQNFNNSPAGVIYNLCAKHTGCNTAALAGPDLSAVFVSLIISCVALMLWMIGRMMIAVRLMHK